MPTAEDVFSDTFRQFLKNWTMIVGLRQTTDVALPIAEVALGGIHANFVEQIATDPESRRIFVSLHGTDKPVSEEVKQLIGNGITKEAITSARSAVNAASLVFAQSILDDCAWSYCKVCALANPADWDTLIIATGGIYDAQTQMASFNFVEPYLRSVFGFLGVTDATFLTTGGTAALNYGQDRDAFLAPHLQAVQTHAQAI